MALPISAIHKYRFSGNSQDNIGDLHFITQTGTPIYTQNMYQMENSAVGFNKLFNYYVSTAESLEGTLNFSYSFWFKLNTSIDDKQFTSLYTGKYYYNGGGSNSTYSTICFEYSSSKVYIRAFNTKSSMYLSSTDNTWHNCVITIDKSLVVKIFIDGVLYGNTSYADAYIYYNSGYLFLGKSYVSSSSIQNCSIDIDEFTIYNTTLTDGNTSAIGDYAAGEVFDIYKHGVEIQEAPSLNNATNITQSSATITWS
jgi:hypothetical protein